MKRFFKILGIVVLIVIVAIAALFLVTTAERQIARQFVLDVTSGAYADARQHFHPSLANQYPLERMQSGFDRVDAYQEVSFSGIQVGIDHTELYGTARTASGCASVVEFELIDNTIISFNIEPICPKP